MTGIRSFFSSKVVKVLAIVLGAFLLLLAGLTAGIVLTNLGFNNERAKIQELQTQLEEAEASADELAEVTARAEDAEAQLEEAQDEVEDLQAINNSLEERIGNLKDGLATASETPTQSGGLVQEYINWKFWTDGNRYQATGENVFHSDPECKNELENEEVVLISPVVSTDKIKDDSGEIITVYTSLSENGFVYSREVPNINPV